MNLAAGLAERGLRTLLLDSDPQGNATSGIGLDKTKVHGTLYDVYEALVDDPSQTRALENAIVNVSTNLDAVPATLDVAGAEAILMNAVGKELILRDAIEAFRETYDWIIVDAPPSLGLLTINILAASDRALVPMQCEYYALEGLSQLVRTIDIVRRRINPNLEIAKVLLTMHDPRNKLTQQVQDEVQGFFDGKVAKAVIPRNVRLSEAPSFGEPAISRFPSSKGSVAYRHLVDEVIKECAAH